VVRAHLIGHSVTPNLLRDRVFAPLAAARGVSSLRLQSHTDRQSHTGSEKSSGKLRPHHRRGSQRAVPSDAASPRGTPRPPCPALRQPCSKHQRAQGCAAARSPLARDELDTGQGFTATTRHGCPSLQTGHTAHGPANVQHPRALTLPSHGLMVKPGRRLRRVRRVGRMKSLPLATCPEPAAPPRSPRRTRAG